MVAVSERAKELLLERKREASIDPEVGLRVSVDPSGRWILVADHPRSGDQIVEHAGVTVLLVSPDLQTALAGTKVDCIESSDGEVELTLTRPGTYNGHP